MSTMEEKLKEIELYVQENPESTNTQLFSFVVLLRAYVPYSYLLMSECQKILGPPDPIHGGPPFEERMIPFAALINVSGAEAQRRCSIDHGTAQRVLELLANLRFANGDKRFTRSNIMKKLIRSHHVQYIKDLLTKREMGEKAKEPFSRLITDIKNTENHYQSVSVLETASDTFKEDPFFPQTISRLYYKKADPDYEEAQKWASEAIKRAPHNSYVADTLGQIYKKRLMKARTEDVIRMADEAFKAFEDVEEKAEREVARDTEDAVSNSNSFNNRGLFGFIQVAKLAIERYPQPPNSLIQNKRTKVEDKFDFFEWYLTYSKPDKKTPEPDYFWEDVALCYQRYTENSAAESTSFAGLLDSLNHGLVTSKGRRAGFEEAEKTVSELETIQRTLKGSYEEQPKSVDLAERYILSNIILSNKKPDSPHITPMAELKEIISEFLRTDVGRRSPEFYLLVLLLFWPEVEQNQNVTLDLETYATYMERAFERSEFAKYLRGRYLLPLFFLGKGSGLSKWIHKSRLDAIMENQEDTDGDMLEIPEIQDMLLPVTVEPCHAATTPQEHENQEVVVCVGESKIKATTEGEAEGDSPNSFYLGVTIRGLVVFKVRPSPTDTNLTN